MKAPSQPQSELLSWIVDLVPHILAAVRFLNVYNQNAEINVIIRDAQSGKANNITRSPRYTNNKEHGNPCSWPTSRDSTTAHKDNNECKL
jgi:hypothetical protein